MCMYISYKSSVVLTILHYVVKWTNEEKWCDGALYVVTDLKLLVCHMNKKNYHMMFRQSIV